MRKIPITGDGGLSGWTVDQDELEAYFSHMSGHWDFWARLWQWFIPAVTRCRIAYERPDGGISIVTPSDHFMMLLRRGGAIRHMRIVDTVGPRGIPVFEGSGELMASMSEREALEFIAWKDIPIGTNRISFLTMDDIPVSRTQRDQWAFSEDGRSVIEGTG